MKLDRNINPDGRGKYALVKVRSIRDGDTAVDAALRILDDAGILDWGTTPETEFFVIRLKDEYAPNALFAYGIAATVHGDPEYGQEIEEMSRRSGVNHPNCKKPD